MKLRALVWLVLIFGAQPSLCLIAQDVTVSEPRWISSQDLPDELPRTKSRLRPAFPEEMKKAAEYGYVIAYRFMDGTGKILSSNANGTHSPYTRAVQEAFGEWSTSGAKRGGEPVDASIWVSAIFNPKSASVKGPDVTPRLLTVTPVFTTERPAPAGQPPLVKMKLTIDAAGTVSGVQPVGEVKAKLVEAIALAVKTWQFAPARKGGQAIEAEVTLPVLCQPPINVNAPKMVLPRALTRSAPEYPYAMRRFGLDGQVMLAFEVDVDGKVINPVVHESDNPAFDEPALKSLLSWKFQPGTRDGKPIKAKMQVPIIFQLTEGGEKGILRMARDNDQTKLPPELRYDIAPKARGVMFPVYPLEARQAGVTGKAVVAMLIDLQGRVSQVKVVSADRPEFGLALSAAVEGFRFDPAFKDGKPVPHLMRFEQEFNRIMLPDQEGDELLSMEKKNSARIVGGDKLDTTLVPLSRRSPIFPVQVPADVTEGKATIEFLVDSDGHARLPRVVSASDPAFGYAGMQAVSTWLFVPPRVAGKAVTARVRVPLVFDAKPAKAKAAAGTGSRDGTTPARADGK